MRSLAERARGSSETDARSAAAAQRALKLEERARCRGDRGTLPTLAVAAYRRGGAPRARPAARSRREGAARRRVAPVSCLFARSIEPPSPSRVRAATMRERSVTARGVEGSPMKRLHERHMRSGMVGRGEFPRAVSHHRLITTAPPPHVPASSAWRLWTAQETKRFFRNNFFTWNFLWGSCGIALNSTTRRHPRLGLVSGYPGHPPH